MFKVEDTRMLSMVLGRGRNPVPVETQESVKLIEEERIMGIAREKASNFGN